MFWSTMHNVILHILVKIMCSFSQNSYRLQRVSVKMNGFNSKVICKNSSVTIWEILFNIAIPIIHHKLFSNGEFVITMGGGVCDNNLSLWTPTPTPGSVTTGNPCSPPPKATSARSTVSLSNIDFLWEWVIFVPKYYHPQWSAVVQCFQLCLSVCLFTMWPLPMMPLVHHRPHGSRWTSSNIFTLDPSDLFKMCKMYTAFRTVLANVQCYIAYPSYIPMYIA